MKLTAYTLVATAPDGTVHFIGQNTGEFDDFDYFLSKVPKLFADQPFRYQSRDNLAESYYFGEELVGFTNYRYTTIHMDLPDA